MTERLYYTDSHLTEFESVVTACLPVGDRFEVALAATAFYPTGGGQPHDVGTLGGVPVLDVIDREQAGVAHVLGRPLDTGARVTGVIDWNRRFDHMQQHSGQHILSAAFEAVGKARTESFHLGAGSCTIDLHRMVSPAEVAAAEDEANRVVWRDGEVRICFAPADDAMELALRKEPTRSGTLRLIEMAGFDRSACGGTHVARTGAVGLIGVLGWEKFKGGTRVEFVCGGRALRRIREWRDVFSATSRVLSVLPGALAPAIERLQAENKSLGRSVRDLQGQLAVHKAAELVASAVRTADGRALIAASLDGWDVAGLKAVATAAAVFPQTAIAVFSGSSPAMVVVARSAGGQTDASAVLKGLIDRFGGKGGGKADFAQGGGLQGTSQEMVSAALRLLGA